MNTILISVYINVKENTAKGEEYDQLKKFIAWNFDCHVQYKPLVKCVVFMDMSMAGVSNLVG